MNGNAIRVAKIATCEVEDDIERDEDGKEKARPAAGGAQ